MPQLHCSLVPRPVESLIANLGIELGRVQQAEFCPAVALVEGFAQDELPTVGIVAQIKPVGNRAPIPNRVAQSQPVRPASPRTLQRCEHGGHRQSNCAR